jgi:hypothetical protein
MKTIKSTLIALALDPVFRLIVVCLAIIGACIWAAK